MNLNPDCVRDVLLAVEACPFNETLNVGKLSALLPNYSEEDLWYTCLKLKEGNLIDADTVPAMTSVMPGIKAITCLTYNGHEFLANIQKDTVWTGVKDIAKQLGIASLSGLVQIASGVATALIKAHFGLA